MKKYVSSSVRLRHRYLGLNRDYHDTRDIKYQRSNKELLKKVDLTPSLNDIYDQEDLNASSAFNVISLIEYNRELNGLKDTRLSPLFLYYCARRLERTVKFDSGCSLRSCFKAAIRFGCIGEDFVPYITNQYNAKIQPHIWRRAHKDLEFSYTRLNHYTDDPLDCLSNGHPFIFGITVHSSFKPDESGIIPLPSHKRDHILGYQAMQCVGYTDTDLHKGYFIVKNTWGRSWGNKGFCLMPANMLMHNPDAFDFWTIRPLDENGEAIDGRQHIVENVNQSIDEDEYDEDEYEEIEYGDDDNDGEEF